MGQDSLPYQRPFNGAEIRIDVIIRSQYSCDSPVAVSCPVKLKYNGFILCRDCARPAGFTDWTWNREDRIWTEVHIIFYRLTRGKTVAKSLHFPGILQIFEPTNARGSHNRLSILRQRLSCI